ncbi:MAG: RluA family pseudouridine synthase [Rikenellaceae bacterium]
MFQPNHIIYEDNHLLVVNKLCGDLVQPDPSGSTALEDQVKSYIKVRDNKPGDVFLGVVHRIDRPVSGVVLFAKTSKALTRMNEQIRDRKVEKRYWAVVESAPAESHAELTHHISRDTKQNRSRATLTPRPTSKEAKLRYEVIGASRSFTLIEVELITGRHHQIRAQLSAIGSPIKGDLKYGSRRSNPDGGISLHSQKMSFTHPVTKEQITITAPTPADDKIWSLFNDKQHRQ